MPPESLIEHEGGRSCRCGWRGPGPSPLPLPCAWPCTSGACAVFVAIVFVRGGPNPAETDAHAVTLPATAISHGDLRSAERQTLVPNPPGYPLLTSPLVLALRPWIGSPRWCDDKPVPADPADAGGPGTSGRSSGRARRATAPTTAGRIRSGTGPRRSWPSSVGSCSRWERGCSCGAGRGRGVGRRASPVGAGGAARPRPTPSPRPSTPKIS